MNENPRSNRPPAVVLGAYQTGLVLMRNLRRHGIDACCIDCNPDQPGFKSVYGKAYLCPNPDTDPQALEQFMVDFGQKIGRKAVLIASSDLFVSAMSNHAEALS